MAGPQISRRGWARWCADAERQETFISEKKERQETAVIYKRRPASGARAASDLRSALLCPEQSGPHAGLEYPRRRRLPRPTTCPAMLLYRTFFIASSLPRSQRTRALHEHKGPGPAVDIQVKTLRK